MESSLFRSASIFILIFIGFNASARFSDETHPLHFGDHHGYVGDVTEERNKRDIEMVMLDKPKSPPPPPGQKVFNEKLSKEFKDQYAYRFGQTNSEQLLQPKRDDQYLYYTGERLTVQQYADKQKQFAEFMVRRLTEFHIDDYAKHDRDFRQVYELKDRVSNLDVKVASYKFLWKYNFAGPSMDINVKNPYDIDFKVRMEMDGIISSPSEYIYTVGYAINPRISTKFVHRQKDGLYQSIWSRRMTKHISTSITGSVDTKVFGPVQQQNLFLVGLSWSE